VLVLTALVATVPPIFVGTSCLKVKVSAEGTVPISCQPSVALPLLKSTITLSVVAKPCAVLVKVTKPWV